MAHKHKHEITVENERKTLTVIIFTVVTMVVEIVYGYITHSMALLADGFHMGSHALALGLTYIAYILIRKFKDSDIFPLGTNKIGVLTAYTSSLFLGFMGIWIIIEALQRLFYPVEINFNDAILVAVAGLLVNSICIYIMENHNKSHKKNDEAEDYNFKAAYYHILADALTSILAIVALLIGKYFNFGYLDPVVGIMSGILIIKWAIGLLKKTVAILIDMKQVDI